VGQVLNIGVIFLQRLATKLSVRFQLGIVHRSQLVVPIVVIKCLNDFIPCMCRDAIQEVEDLPFQDYPCVTFSRSVQLVCLATASTWQWNRVQDIDPSNFSSFVLSALSAMFPKLPRPQSGFDFCWLWFELLLFGFYQGLHRLYVDSYFLDPGVKFLLEALESVLVSTHVRSKFFLAVSKFALASTRVLLSYSWLAISLCWPAYMTFLSSSWPALNLFKFSRIAYNAGLIFDPTSYTYCNN
jgi:hypothetical protein